MTDRRSPVIAPEALAERLGAPDLRIMDIRWVLGAPGRGREAYAAGHIPGAVFVDLDTDLAAPTGPGRHPLPDPVAFRHRMEQLGVHADDEVVAYDDVGGSVAARLWWMLDNLGHRRASVLDGGYPAWVAAGFPVTTDVPSTAAADPDSLRLAEAWTRTIDRDMVAGALGTIVLLDARAAPRYRGEVEPVDPMPGHIPTAISAPTSGNLGPDGRLMSAEALTERYRSLGADGSDGPVVSSCGSGVTACFTSLAMRVAGLPDPILYAGSYSDWTRSGLPVAVGSEPGEPVA